MRVLVVSQYFWPENFRINALVESLVTRGVEVEVLTGKPNYPDGVIASGYRAWGCKREHWRGATLHRVPLFPRGKNNRLGLLLNYLSFIIFGMVCGSWMVRKRHYDVVFVYGLSPIFLAIPALFIGWLKNKKSIVWVQDLWPESLSATGYIRNEIIMGVVRKVVRFIYRHADLLLVQSPAFESPIRELAADTPIVYYPNSVDDTFSSIVSDEGIPLAELSGGFSVMFAGNIGAAQAVGVIVEAASLLKEYKDIQFVILGDGSCRPVMVETARQHGLTNIHFPGRFPVETMPAFMQTASVLLVTLADRPIFSATIPSKVQAYLASGRPIIACLNGEGARLIVEAKAGLATPAEDGKALSETILRLYQLSPNERAEMGENGRRYHREHFDHNSLVDKLILHLRSACK